MRKHIVVAVAVLVVAVVVGAGMFLRWRVDATSYARHLLPQVERQIGRQVTVGSVHIRLWPTPGLSLQDVSIAEKDVTPRRPVLTAKSLRVHIRLLPLLRRHIVIRQVVIERPTLTVARDETGQLSFADLLGTREGEVEQRTPGTEASLPVAVSLDGTKLKIAGGELRFVDHAAARRVSLTRITNIDVTARQLDAGRDHAFEIEADIGKPPRSGRVAVTGDVRRTQDGWRIGQLPVRLEVRATTVDLAPFRSYWPGAWGDWIRSGIVTADVSMVGRADRELAVRGKLRVDSAELGDGSLEVVGAVEGEIEGTAGRGIVSGKADLRLAPGRFAQGSFVVDGHTLVVAAIRAGRGEFRSHIRIDATAANYRHGSVLQKPVGTKLVVEGDLSRARTGLLIRRVSGELGTVAFGGTAEIESPATDGGSTPFALHFEPARFDLSSVPAYVPATVPFALRGRADVTRVDVVRRPGAAREWQVASDFRLTDAQAVFPVGDGRAHQVEALAAEVHIEPGLLTAGEGRAVLNGVPLAFQGQARDFMAMLVSDPDRDPARVHFEVSGQPLRLDGLLRPTASVPPSPGEVVGDRVAASSAGDGVDAQETERRGTDRAEVEPPPAERPFLQRFVVDHGALHAREAVYGSWKLRDFNAVLGYAAPVLSLRELWFDAHGGRWTMGGAVTFDGGPSVALDLRADHALVDELLAASWTSWDGKARGGTLDVETRLRARGSTLAAWEKTLQGSGHVTVRGGRLLSFNLMDALSSAVLRTMPAPIRPASGVSLGGHNDFERFEQTFRIDGGRVHTSDALLLTEDYVLRGQGSLGLDGTLDYMTQVALTATGTQRMIALAALPIPGSSRVRLPAIPVKVKGQVGSPAIQADVSGLSKSFKILWGMGAAAKNAVERAVGAGAGAIQRGLGRAPEHEPEDADDSGADDTER